MSRAINFLGVILCSLIGCVDGTARAPDMCNVTPVGKVPAVALPGVSFKPVTFSTKADFSDVFEKIDSITGGLDIVITRFSFDGSSNLDWVSSIDVSVKGNTPDLPPVAFGSYRRSETAGDSVAMTVSMSAEEAKRYLSHSLTMTYTVSGTAPTEEVTVTNTLCVDASGEFHKSL